jgi:HSP20 family protein
MANLSKRESSMQPWYGRGLGALREEMNDLFGRFFGEEQTGFFPAARSLPSVDLSETAGAVEVKMDLPGLKPEEIEIDVRGDLLTVSGERREEQESKAEGDRKYHRVERRYGSFSRSVRLPAPIDENKVNAQYRDGVLSITLPKSEEAKTRKIKVKG